MSYNPNESLQEIIEKKSMEIAREHARIIEQECQSVIDRFNVLPMNLIIEYETTGKININIKATSFKIENNFTIKDGILNAQH